jgi:hypothetical protein
MSWQRQIVMAGCLWSLAAAGVAEVTGPVLLFSQPHLDVGTVRVGELAPFHESIEFTNSGDQPLILSNVRGCCGTRITQWPQAPVMPGETGQIDVQFRLAPRPHTVRRTVTVTSNATIPTQAHSIIGQVIPDDAVPEVAAMGPKLVFSQPLLDMGEQIAAPGGGVMASVCFDNQGDEPLRLVQVRASNGSVVREWSEEPIPPGESATIEVEVMRQEDPGFFSRNVFLFANDEARRHIYRVIGQWVDP